MVAADSGSGAGGEIAGRTSSWCALWATDEGEEGREGAEEGAAEGAEEGAARRAIEAAVERAAWLTGLSPAHAEECQVVTTPEPNSHPTPSSPYTRAPAYTHPAPTHRTREPGGALHSRPGVPRPRRLLLLCGRARPRAHGRGAVSKSIAHASPVPEDGPGGTWARPASANQPFVSAPSGVLAT